MKSLYLSIFLLLPYHVNAMENNAANTNETAKETLADARKHVHDARNHVRASLFIAHTYLVSQNAAERSEGLRHLFNFHKDTFDTIKIIRAQQDNTLIYLGDLSNCLRKNLTLFNSFIAGNFAFEVRSSLVHGKSLLVAGRNTLPTSNEYTSMTISKDPASLRSDITTTDITQTCTQAIKDAENN